MALSGMKVMMSSIREIIRLFSLRKNMIHDAYDLRTLETLDAAAKKAFGPDLEGVRDIYMMDRKGKNAHD